MSASFKAYRKFCFTAIRELLCHKETECKLWMRKAKETKTVNELSRVMVEVRHSI